MKRLSLTLLFNMIFLTITATAVAAAGNCTLTLGYWKNHPASWLTDTLTLGNQSYTKTQLLDILDASPEGDITYILAHQLIAAKLNQANGADTNIISDTLTNADSWLTVNPLGSNPQGPERDLGVNYSSILNDYNEGSIGPGHCPPTAVTLASLSAQTESRSSTLTLILCGFLLVISIILLVLRRRFHP